MDDNFEKLLTDGNSFVNNQTVALLNEWCREAQETSPVGYYNNLFEHELTVYTRSPGRMIGKSGLLITKYQEMFSQAFHADYSVNISEIKGGFANLK